MVNGVNKQGAYESGHSDVAAPQASAESITSILNAPVSKLDADQYSAEDIDGITEGLFGSGNLNYLMMQGSQTDEAAMLNRAFDGTFASGDASAFSLGMAAPPSALTSTGHGINAGSMDLFKGTDTDRSMPDTPPPAIDNGSDGFFANTTLGSLGASSLVANGFERVIGGSPTAGGDGQSGLNGDSGTPGTPGTSGTNGVNGASGSNGTDGVDGGGGGIINIINNDIDFNFGDINLGDIIIDIDIIHNILNELVGDGLTLDLNVILSDISELLLSINDITILNEIIDLNPVLDVVGDIFDLADLITGELGVHIGLLGGDAYLEPGDYDLLLGGTLNLAGIEIPLLDLDIPLDPLEAVLGDIDIDIGAALGGITGLLNGSGEDTDLALDLAGLGIPVAPLNIVFDPVEDLVGDLDIAGALGLDLLHLQGNNIDNATGDTDLNLGLGIDLLDNTLLGNGLDVPLDAVETLVGDIDLDLTVAGDLLGAAADGLIDTALGGTGEDTLLSGVGDLAGGLVGNLLPGMNGDDTSDGDVDLGGALNLFGDDAATTTLDGILDPVEGLTAGDIDLGMTPNIELFGSQIDNAEGDTDIDIDLDIGVLGIDLPPVDLEIPLDPVEAIIGDIDFGMDSAIHLLEPGFIDDTLGGLVDGAGQAVDDLLAWPENILPDAGDILSGGLLGGGDGSADILPDPLGSVAEGLGLLPFAQDHGGSSGGLGLGSGLFGGGLLG